MRSVSREEILAKYSKENPILIEERIKLKDQNAASRPLKMTNKYVPTKEKSLVKIGGVTICSVGNISVWIAPPASGKSNLVEAAGAGTVNPACDCMGLTINSDRTLSIDTERVHNDLYQGLKRIQKRSGRTYEEILEKLDLYSFLTLDTTEDMKRELKALIEEGGYELLILDGVGDFVKSVNDEEESRAFWRWLISIINKHHMGCIVTIHPNPDDKEGKATGHLGSQGMKKAESVFNLFKSADHNDIRILTTESGHGKVRNGFDKLKTSFKWDSDKGYFISADGVTHEKTIIKTLLDLFEVKRFYTYKDLKSAYIYTYKIGQSTKFERELKDAKSLDRLIETEHPATGKKVYLLNNEIDKELTEEEFEKEKEENDVPF